MGLNHCGSAMAAVRPYGLLASGRHGQQPGVGERGCATGCCLPRALISRFTLAPSPASDDLSAWAASTCTCRWPTICNLLEGAVVAQSCRLRSLSGLMAKMNTLKHLVLQSWIYTTHRRAAAPAMTISRAEGSRMPLAPIIQPRDLT